MNKPTIKCCICLNRGAKTEAIVTIRGYSVCANHVELVSNPDFDIFRLGKESRAL